MRGVSACYAILVLVCLISAPAKAVASPSPILIDDWWNVDFARNSCNGTSSVPDQPECRFVDAVADIQNFEDSMLTFMIRDPQCSGVRVARYAGPKAPLDPAVAEVMKQAGHWTLLIIYHPGVTRQQWELKRDQPSIFTKGEGDPKQVANDLCSIANGRGARVD